MKTNKSFKQDAIICLAAGKSQESLLVKAKSLGYVIVAVDRNADAVGFKYADECVCESTYNAQAIIKKLDLFGNKYNWMGVLNRSSGPPVVVAAELSERYNIPGVPVATASLLVNKDQLREICTKYDLPTPKYKICLTTDNEPIEILKFPVVVKPALSLVGKSGITVVSSKDGLPNAIEYAKEKTINKRILIEEYLPGPDLTLVSFCLGGRICPICLLDELNIEINGKVTSRGYRVHTATDKKDLELMATTIAQSTATALNIKRSPFMASFRMATDGTLRLIEIHLDLGGDLLIEEVFPRALSYDFEELAVKMCIGEGVCPNDRPIMPTAIFYERGEGLLNERGFQVITADSHQLLDKKIMEVGM